MSEVVDIIVVEQSEHDNGFNTQSADAVEGELRVTSVQDMVDKVLNQAGGRRIRSLNIVGHGSSGNQSVGDGQTFDSTGNSSLTLNGDNSALIGDAEDKIKRLRTKFTGNAVVTLGGCGVAEGERGKALLKRVSSILHNVQVQGSEHAQYARAGLEGTVIRCQGDVCWVESNPGNGERSKKKK